MGIICSDEKRNEIKRKTGNEIKSQNNNNSNNQSNNNNSNNKTNKSKSNKSKSNKKQNKIKSNNNPNGQIEDDSTYGTPEELQGIINSLLERKKYLENKFDKKLNTPNNYNKKPNSLKDYQLIIDNLGKEVLELEKLNNIWKIQNKNTQINFFLSTGETYIINVGNDTKLGDAFKNAVLNGQFNVQEYAINMNKKTNYSNAYSSTTLSKEKFNYEQTIFLSEGKNLSENFRNNDPVSLLENEFNSPISILVKLPAST